MLKAGARVSREPLREGSAPSNRNFDSTRPGVCVTVKRGRRAGPYGVRGPVS
jgi:hypothetical protein